ncbi:MAG: cycloisomerase, partial [Hyphomicrobiales bacterium]|nr:cycloisomerase [Hyphomicrobiales bacterium]
SADRLIAGHPDAKAALEAALLDIAGKAAELPVAELIGGRCRDTIPLSFSVANPDFAADLDKIAELHGDGIRLFKLKTGFAGHRFDLDRLEALRDRYDDIDLRIDYNQGLEPFDALRTLRDIEAFRPSFIEQPVAAANRAAMATITAALDTPILADESVFTPAEALVAVRDRIADGFSIKIMKSGGLRKAQTIAEIAAAAGLGAYGGDMFESGLGHLAGTHLVAATPAISFGCEFYQARYYLETDILAEPFPVEYGAVVVPTTPGLGIDVDEKALERFTVEARG